MKKIYLALSFSLAITCQLSAQTYADDVAQIMFDKCTSCHHAGGVAPMSLMTYTDAFSYAPLIQAYVNNGSMPPWPPNNSYSQFAHDRSLSATEIATIDSWVTAGAPQGNASNTPPAPVYNGNTILGSGDLTVKAPTYISKATSSQDDYVCFSMPITGLVTTETIQAIEVIPGDPSIVHHVLLYIDPAGNYPTDTTSHTCTGPSSQSIPLIGGFAPGSVPIQFPNTPGLKMGINVSPGSRIIFAMHYPEGSQGKIDSTKVNFHFYPQGTTGVRQVSANPFLSNTSFNINANTVGSVQGWFPSQTIPIPSAYSLFGIFPHAHLLGQSFIVYGVKNSTPYDTIPLIHIPKWDFDWQGFYTFKYMKKLPAGYKLYGKCIYDNTTNNPFNPNTPPQNVGFGLNTSDEMFLVYFQYLPYQAGDENINIDSLLQLQVPTGTSEPLAIHENGLFLTSYPNPSNGLTTIHYYTEGKGEVSLGIYDIQGKLVKQLVAGTILSGEQFSTWDGTNDAGSPVPSGVYISQLKAGDKMSTSKIVRTSK